MRTIKFDVEDSKVSGILQDLLNSGVAVKNVEVTSTQHSKTPTASEPCIVSVEDTGSSFTLYRHGSSSTEVISGVKLVGGTIFYIDDTADGEYQFFDTWGNPIENVQVGDRPYYYRVIKEGSKDKYYVYYDKVYDNLRWTYCKDKKYVYESLRTLRSGKIDTAIVMTEDNGAYVTADSNGSPTIWYQLQQVRDSKAGGCDDWFVPSGREAERLRRAIKAGAITGGTIAGSSYEESVFSKKDIWSSSKWSDQDSWFWYCDGQFWYNYNKNHNFSVFFVRAF